MEAEVRVVSRANYEVVAVSVLQIDPFGAWRAEEMDVWAGYDPESAAESWYIAEEYSSTDGKIIPFNKLAH